MTVRPHRLLARPASCAGRHTHPAHTSRGARSLLSTLLLVAAALACQENRRGSIALTREEQTAIRVALDSFPRIEGEASAVERTLRRGDTTVVELISNRGVADPGKWDGPRLLVWIVRPSRIVRSEVKIVN
jgi:hypothetical protein